MSLLMMTTTTAQSVLANGIIPLTTIARRKCQSIQGGNNTVVITKAGYYKISGTITFTGAAGNVSIELLKNGNTVSGINTAATISTADTQIKTLSIDGIVRVYCGEIAILSLLNSGVAIDTSNVELSVTEA